MLQGARYVLTTCTLHLLTYLPCSFKLSFLRCAVEQHDFVTFPEREQLLAKVGDTRKQVKVVAVLASAVCRRWIAHAACQWSLRTRP